MKTLAALLITLLPLAAVPDDITYRLQKEKYDMWMQACERTKHSCVGVAMPKLRYVKTRPGLYGYYQGLSTIYVSKDLYGDNRRATTLHEMSHYIDVMAGGLMVPGFAEPICKSEADAFALVDGWWRDIGRPNKQRGPKWWRPYTHCHRFYNPDWEEMKGWFIW